MSFAVHGCEIWVPNGGRVATSGRGSRFTMTVPAK